MNQQLKVFYFVTSLAGILLTLTLLSGCAMFRPEQEDHRCVRAHTEVWKCVREDDVGRKHVWECPVSVCDSYFVPGEGHVNR